MTITTFMSTKTALKRAEELLRELLNPEQLADYKKTAAFNVRGSDGVLYRLTPRYVTAHQAVTYLGPAYGGCDCYDCRRRHRELYPNGLEHTPMGMSTWPNDACSNLPGDWAIAVMLNLMNDAKGLQNIACKGYVRHEYLAEANGGDYGGAI